MLAKGQWRRFSASAFALADDKPDSAA